ncbi:glycosyltransferase [Aestuariirhabdus sp. Z084]|uniref:glycosyltransferase n=1 Tax=Aestuariirhabdus haliotis TaxID=2918751 RepID=UPI00201B437F|nr:glycosyltransferase [Aestuariirhabdus haliotis]MCL6415724.1 glycosyltransferase [Aestuariirhabdus haliotis]MCL6419750.1 glycosyltransferase [Aestuariirhabdus haliotis]
MHNNIRVAVLLPCFNEEAAIESVVRDFRESLPDAEIFVFDNNSTDRTVELARNAGATVFLEKHQGKGYVVRRMFSDVDADVYVLADGDGTYFAPASKLMVEKLLSDNLDMVVGVRKSKPQDDTYRMGHHFGNRLFTKIVGFIFGNEFTDILSGYRIMSRRFVKSFPSNTRGFEIETQLTIHALELTLPCEEYPTPYVSRVEGSESKLNTYRDGFRILFTIGVLFKETRPFLFFGLMAVMSASLSFALGLPIIVEYIETGLVPRIPTAVLASGVGVMSLIFIIAGITLDTVSRKHRELKRLFYNSLSSVRGKL